MNLKTCIYIILILFPILSFSQDKIVLRDSTIINCKIIKNHKNIIQYEDFKTLTVKTVDSDTIKNYTYNGVNSYYGHLNKTQFDYKDPNLNCIFYRLSFITPAFSIENKINSHTTNTAEFGFSLGFSYNSTEGTKVYMDPYVKMELRRYLNLKQRQKNQKSTKNFSGNYISLLIAAENRSFIFGPTYGIQRNINKFYINFGLSALCSITGTDYDIYPHIGINIGKLLSNSRH